MEFSAAESSSAASVVLATWLLISFRSRPISNVSPNFNSSEQIPINAVQAEWRKSTSHTISNSPKSLAGWLLADPILSQFPCENRLPNRTGRAEVTVRAASHGSPLSRFELHDLWVAGIWFARNC